MSDFKLANLIKRNSQLLLNMAGMFGAKCLAMVVQLLTVPAYLSYFQEQTVLGVWYSLLSILNLVLTFDLGLGNGDFGFGPSTKPPSRAPPSHSPRNRSLFFFFII